MQRQNSFRGTISFRTVRAVLLAGALLCSHGVQGGGVVTNCDWPSLQTALNGGGTVTFACDGTILLTNSILITKDILTTNTTLDASGHQVVLDGNQAVRHFVVTNSATLRLINLTLINGRFAGADAQTNQPGNPGLGGAIYNSGGTLELVGCRFVSNRVMGGNGGPPTDSLGVFPTPGGPAYGGAIYSINGQLYLTNCLFVGNQAFGNIGLWEVSESSGGAIFSKNGVVAVQSTTFTNNVVSGGGHAGSGGAIADIDGMTTITNCIFLSNFAQGGTCCIVPLLERGGIGQAANGGAVCHDGGSLAIAGSQFLGNQVVGGNGGDCCWFPGQGGDGNGGALFNNTGELTARSCLFAHNQSSGGSAGVRLGSIPSGTGLGGAILSKGTLRLENSTLVGNIASGGPASRADFGSDVHNGGPAFGGGIFNRGGLATLLNVTLANNIVTNSDTTELALGDNLASTTNMPITLMNTILFHSQSKTNVFGPITDGGHNLCSDSSAKFSSSTSRNNTDPLLAPLTDNGGPTPTMALLPGSPAIDAGDDSLCPGTDQRGVPRPIGAHCDIGAYESVPAPALIRGPSGNVRVQFTWQPQQNLTAQATTDFATWTAIGTATTSTNGFVEFKDTSAAQFSLRFYRAISQ